MSTEPEKKKRGAPKGSKGGPGRNPISPGKRKVPFSASVTLQTRVALEVHAKTTGQLPGAIIDKLVQDGLLGT